MDFLQKKIEELSQANLDEEIGDLLGACDEEFGAVGKEKDSIVNARVEKVERIRVRPSDPFVKHGSLLSCTEDVSGEDIFNWGTALKAAPLTFGNIEEVRLGLSEHKTNTVDSLFEVSKRMNKNLLVVGDYIEIIKTTVVSDAEDGNQKTTKKGIMYNITHYVEVLDSEKMYRIPALTFAPEEEDAWNPNTLCTEELNFREIMERYKNADLEEVLHPLKVVVSSS